MRQRLKSALAVFASSTVGPTCAYEVTTHAKISNAAYLQARLGSDPSLISSLGLAEWTFPLTQDVPFGGLYYDVSGPTIYSRVASDYEANLLKRADLGLFNDRFRINGWLMRGAVREDDAVFPFANSEQPWDDPYGGKNRFCNHF